MSAWLRNSKDEHTLFPIVHLSIQLYSTWSIDLTMQLLNYSRKMFLLTESQVTNYRVWIFDELQYSDYQNTRSSIWTSDTTFLFYDYENNESNRTLLRYVVDLNHFSCMCCCCCWFTWKVKTICCIFVWICLSKDNRVKTSV